MEIPPISKRYTPEEVALTTGVVSAIITCLALKAFKKNYTAYAQYTIPLNLTLIAGSYIWAKNRGPKADLPPNDPPLIDEHPPLLPLELQALLEEEEFNRLSLLPSEKVFLPSKIAPPPSLPLALLELQVPLTEEGRENLLKLQLVDINYQQHIQTWRNLGQGIKAEACSVYLNRLESFIKALEGNTLSAARIDLHCDEELEATDLANVETLLSKAPALKILQLNNVKTLDTTTLTLEHEKYLGNFVSVPQLKSLHCHRFELAERLLVGTDQVALKLKGHFTNQQILQLLRSPLASLDLSEVSGPTLGLIAALKERTDLPLLQLPNYLLVEQGKAAEKCSFPSLDSFVEALANETLSARWIDLHCDQPLKKEDLQKIQSLLPKVPSLQILQLHNLEVLDTTTLTLEQERYFGNFVRLPHLKRLHCNRFELAERLLAGTDQVDVKLSGNFTDQQILELLCFQPASLDLRAVKGLTACLIPLLKEVSLPPLIYLPPSLYGRSPLPLDTYRGPLGWSLLEIPQRALCPEHHTLTPCEVALWLKEDQYTHLSGNNNITRIVADHVEALTDANCVAFCRKFPHLTSLALYHCPGITAIGIQALKNAFPQLTLVGHEETIDVHQSGDMITLKIEKEDKTFEVTIDKNILNKQLATPTQQKTITFDELKWPKTLDQEALSVLAFWMSTAKLPQGLSAEALMQLRDIAHPNCGPYLLNLRRAVEMRLSFVISEANIDQIYQFAEEKNIGPLASACQIYAHIFIPHWGQKKAKFDPCDADYADLMMQPEGTGTESQLKVHSELLYASPLLHGYLEEQSANSDTSITIQAQMLNRDTWLEFCDLLYHKEIHPVAKTLIPLHKFALHYEIKDLEKQCLHLLPQCIGEFKDQVNVFQYLAEEAMQPDAAITQLYRICNTYGETHAPQLRNMTAQLMGNSLYANSLKEIAQTHPHLCPPSLTIPYMTPENAHKILPLLQSEVDIEMAVQRIIMTFPQEVQGHFLQPMRESDDF
ncbi:MAG: hypothetical protein JSR80_01085 [Verrucomicrobia bacterium]|nr:hypothetical protein [Verrucomicrobiota bacterium]